MSHDDVLFSVLAGAIPTSLYADYLPTASEIANQIPLEYGDSNTALQIASSAILISTERAVNPFSEFRLGPRNRDWLTKRKASIARVERLRRLRNV